MPGQRQTNVNRMTPAAKKAGLGDAVAELIDQVNKLTVGHNAMAAKLDLDAGVTDTNFAALTGVTATTILTLELRPTST